MVKWFKEWVKLIEEGHKVKYDLNSLYSLTKYGKVMDDESMKEHVLKDIKEQILIKVNNRQYTLVLDLMGDVAKYSKEIIEYFSNEGLTAQKINVVLGKTGKTVEYILITWAK